MLLISSVFTLQIAGIMDPISLLIRSFSLSVYPLINYGLHSFFDALYYANIPLLVDVSESAYSFLKKNFLLFRQPHYFQAIFIGLIFFSILILTSSRKDSGANISAPWEHFLAFFPGFPSSSVR